MEVYLKGNLFIKRITKKKDKSMLKTQDKQ